MKRFLLLAFGLSFAFLASAQFVSLEFEEHYVHDDTEITDPQINDGNPTSLDGYITYRLYANLTNADDFVTSVSGDENDVLRISLTNSSEQFFNHPGGGPGGPFNADFLNFVPLLEYDTHVSIGYDSTDDMVVGFCEPTLIEAADPASLWITSFDEGNDLIVDSFNGGSYFIVASCENGTAGADLRVSLGQFTINAAETGIVATACIQVFTNGIQSEATNIVTCGATASAPVGIIPGCMDPLANNYDVTANFDNGNCIYPCALAIDAADITVSDVMCFGGASGGIVVDNVTGAQGTAMYSINDVSFTPSPNFNDLEIGEYTVYVRDNEGCTANATVTVGTIDAIVIAAAVSTRPSCFGDSDGSLCVDVSGGAGLYVIATSEEGLVTGSTTGCIDDLPEGTYTVFAQDANGCVVSNPGLVLGQPGQMDLDASDFSESTCGEADGCAVALATGGTPPYMYEITDWVDPTELNELCGLVPGSYDIIATDALGCSVSNGPVLIEGPAIVEMNLISITDITCPDSEDGGVCVSGVGGNGNFLYSIGDCDVFTNTDGCFTDLAVGEHTVCVESGGCVGSEAFTVGAPNAITFDATESASGADNCNGSVVISNVSGGTGTVTIVWTLDGNDTTGDTIDGLCVGDQVSVVLTDENGCSVDASYTIILDALYELENNVQISMFPNPTNGKVNIAIEGLSGQVVSAKVINSLGAEVNAIDFGTLSGLWNQEIDLEGNADGIYFINLTVGNELVSHRVIKN